MKVLITGAHGQVGRCLLASLPPGVTAIGLTRTDLDVGDADAVSRTVAAHTPAVIINAAAYTAVDRAQIEVEAARRVNGLGPRHLARAAASRPEITGCAPTGSGHWMPISASSQRMARSSSG